MQIDLFGTESKRDREFREFHTKNPKVYSNLVRLAKQAVERGKTKLSIELLINIVRWEMWLATDDPSSEFKINNNYKSRYARLIMTNEPTLDGMFATREMKS